MKKDELEYMTEGLNDELIEEYDESDETCDGTEEESGGEEDSAELAAAEEDDDDDPKKIRNTAVCVTGQRVRERSCCGCRII